MPHTPSDTHAGGQAADCCVVGVGASAGGLNALQRLFSSVPPDLGVAYVVVQHLSSGYQCELPSLLALHTPLAVTCVQGNQYILPGHVYVVPPGKNVMLQKGRLVLSDFAPGALHHPIDVLFGSIAQQCGPPGAGIVLSGTGTDGVKGCTQLNQSDGLVLVQDAASAQFPVLPGRIEQAGVAHHALPPEVMPAQLLRHFAAQGACDIVAPPAKDAADYLSTILHLVRQHSDIDFARYKPNTLIRRIERRVDTCRLDRVDQYIHFLSRSPTEVEMLLRELLIGVTRFFRDEELFALLRGEVLPGLFAAASPSHGLRAWVVGCSTGEEAFSLAMLLLEARQDDRISVHATDVDRVALQHAQEGAYAPGVESQVPPGNLARYFSRQEGHYRVGNALRRVVRFGYHNALADAPPEQMDLVSCRNLLIYLQPEAQLQLVESLCAALRPGGYLVLGPSESPPAGCHGLVCRSHEWSVYQYLPTGSAACVQPTPVHSSAHDPSGMAIAHPDGRIIFANSVAEAMLRIAPDIASAHYVAGFTLRDKQGRDLPTGHLPAWSGKHDCEQEQSCTLRHAGTAPGHIHLQGQPVRNAAGEVESVIWWLREASHA